MDHNQNFLATEKPGKLMRKYAIPCIISLLVAALYNIVDQIFIGWGVGAEGNGATNIVFPLTVLSLAIATMIGDGACSYISICLGQKDTEKAHRTVGNAVVLTVFSGVVLMAVFFLFFQKILVLFGANDTVSALTRQYAQDYFFYIALGTPFYMFGQAMNPIIRSDGSPRFAMAATLVGAIANIILDPIAIFGLHWGVMGAAVATVAGQILTAALSLFYLFRMKAVRLEKKSFFLSGRLIRHFLPLGFTSFLSQFSLVLAMAVINNVITQYGALSVFGADTPLAVQGIVMKFYQIVISIVVGMAAGCIPIVGYNYGAGCFSRCRRLMRLLLTSEAIVGAVALLLFQLFPVQLISLFGTENDALYYTFAEYAFRIYLCMMILDCVNKAAFIFLQSLGRPVESTLLSLLREVILAIPLAILLPQLFGMWFGMENAFFGVLVSMPCSAILTFIATAFVILSTARRLRRLEKEKTEAQPAQEE